MKVEDMVKSMADVLRDEGKTVGIALGLEQGKAEGLEQGKAEGLEQGKAEGLEQGKAEGEALIKQEAIRKLIQLRFGDIPEFILDQISTINDLSPLDILFDKIWNADSLDEIEF